MTATDPQMSADKRRETANRWCLRLWEGPLTADGQRDFEAWLAEDVGNSAAVDEAMLVWRALDHIRDAPEIIVERAAALAELRRGAAGLRRSRRPVRWGAGLVAALLAIAMLGPQSLQRESAAHYVTAVGERRTFLLADGSRLSLDADTRVDVELLAAHRNLTLLSGRARFDVAHDADRPFTVTAGNQSVLATGTEFSVELIGRQVRVILYEGHVALLRGKLPRGDALVRLTSAVNLHERELSPGNEVIADTVASLPPQVMKVDVSRTLGWEGGQLDFVNEPLARAAERLNRYSIEKIVIGDPTVGALPINGVFNAGDTMAFVDAVSHVYPVSVSHSGREIAIQALYPK